MNHGRVEPEAAASAAATAAKYGPLADIVTNAGFLLAATLALSLRWMKRSGSSWAPPEEAVPNATTRVASLVTAVLLALLYVFLNSPGRQGVLAGITLFFLVGAVAGLLLTIYMIKAYGCEMERTNWRRKKVKTIKRGGKQLTKEAEQIRQSRNVSVDRLVQEAQGDVTLVFEKSSLAGVRTAVTGDVSSSPGVRFLSARLRGHAPQHDGRPLRKTLPV